MRTFVHLSYSGIGGLSEVVLSLVGAATRTGEDRHHVLFHGCEPLPATLEARTHALGCSCHYVPKRRGLDLRSLSAIRDWLFQHRPDVVISHLPQTIFATAPYARACPESRLLTVEHTSNALKTPKDWLMTWLSHRMSHATVLLTEEYAAQMRRRLPGLLRLDRIAVIPNGIDTERFAPAPDAAPDPFPVIGMQARMVPGKDYGTLLRAFAALRASDRVLPARLELAGDGPDRPRWEALCDELGLRRDEDVRFLGLLEQDTLVARMRAWTVFVLATAGETMSRAIMEAQALALPVVSTRVSGVTASIADGVNGLLVPPGDPSALADVLADLLHRPERRRLLGDEARRHAVRHFSARASWHAYRSLALASPIPVPRLLPGTAP
jgi:glycosyltransferase involved in cell wall biosynthesis